MAKKHALLSPSAASRWLRCTAAPDREATVPDTGTDFTREGTLAHAYAAKDLKIRLGIADTRDEDEEISELAAYYSPDMEDYAREYADLVWGRFAKAQSVDPYARLLVETRVTLPGSLGKHCFGTADAIIVNDWLLEVIDLKYGKGVKVSAEENAQMMIYAIGAVNAIRQQGLACPDAIRMTIVQPRIGNISSQEMTVRDLARWKGQVLRPRAKEVVTGTGRPCVGRWCRFCAYSDQCRELAAYCLSTAQGMPDAESIDGDDLAAAILPRLEIIKTWVNSVEARALRDALEGKRISGYKLVEGRSVRKFTDAAAVAARLTERGVEDIYKPQELRTLTDLEKRLGKKTFREICGEWVSKAPGKPTLVEETDPRPVYNATTEFAAVDTNKID